MKFQTPKIQYFFKGITKLDFPEKFKYRFPEPISHKQTAGPDGLGLLCSPLKDCICEYNKEVQNWQKLAGTWIGFSKDFQPSDILRSDAVGGYPVKLGDGRDWVIPVAMLDAPNFSLPQYETLDDNGNWVFATDDRYGHLSIMAKELWNSVNDDGHFSMDENKVRNICISAIAVNYDITDFECAALKLLTKTAYQGIMEALIDLPGKKEIIEHLEGKKKLLEVESMNSGKTDS
ncbi:MAG: hypothetical protein WC900_05195 [Oscillospiraceae bacterium]|jgi:hypothetical protein